jgi:diguanylate cyclase (GGDEF)-like protein
VGNAVIIAKPLWPVLRLAARFLSDDGYRVEETSSWSRLLDSGLSCSRLSGILLGDHGNTTEELEVIRQFRERKGAQGVPIILVGGMNALLRAGKFLSSGVDLVLPADILPGDLVERARPFLRYGSLYQSLSEANRELRELSMRDDLTGLPNRRHFSLDLSRNVEMARRIGRCLSCIIVDIDDFKRINDDFGHLEGDSVIRQFGDVLDMAKRAYDTVARLGGDEFAWLLMDADPDQALHAAGRALRLVNESVFEIAGSPGKLTATFGVSSLLPGVEISAEDLVGNADRALYWGKETGKNSIRFYPPKKVENSAKTDTYIS